MKQNTPIILKIIFLHSNPLMLAHVEDSTVSTMSNIPLWRHIDKTRPVIMGLRNVTPPPPPPKDKHCPDNSNVSCGFVHLQLCVGPHRTPNTRIGKKTSPVASDKNLLSMTPKRKKAFILLVKKGRGKDRKRYLYHGHRYCWNQRLDCLSRPLVLRKKSRINGETICFF